MSSLPAEPTGPDLAPVRWSGNSGEVNPAPRARSVTVYDLGLTRYQDVLELQRDLQRRRREGEGADTLLLTEHLPVLTLGRAHPEPDLRVAPAVVERLGIAILPTERGGDITYHGPGQLVAYGIIDLRGWACGVIDYVDGLEQAAMGVLRDWGIEGEQKPGARGVWVDGRKIASIGVNVRRSVTMHGIALNVEPDMRHFALINPCGMADVQMTTLAAEARKKVPMDEVTESFVYHFARVFRCDPKMVSLPGSASSAG